MPAHIYTALYTIEGDGAPANCLLDAGALQRITSSIPLRSTKRAVCSGSGQVVMNQLLQSMLQMFGNSSQQGSSPRGCARLMYDAGEQNMLALPAPEVPQTPSPSTTMATPMASATSHCAMVAPLTPASTGAVAMATPHVPASQHAMATPHVPALASVMPTLMRQHSQVRRRPRRHQNTRWLLHMWHQQKVR